MKILSTLAAAAKAWWQLDRACAAMERLRPLPSCPSCGDPDGPCEGHLHARDEGDLSFICSRQERPMMVPDVPKADRELGAILKEIGARGEHPLGASLDTWAKRHYSPPGQAEILERWTALRDGPSRPHDEYPADLIEALAMVAGHLALPDDLRSHASEQLVDWGFVPDPMGSPKP